MRSFFSKSGRKALGSGLLKASQKMARGLTLVELLVTMAVLAFGISGVIALQGATMQASASASTLTMATFLAESQSELLRTMDYNRVAFVSQDPEKLNKSGLPCSGSDCFFTRTTTITQKAPLTVSYAVSIKVEWLNKQLVYDTVVSNVGFF